MKSLFMLVLLGLPLSSYAKENPTLVLVHGALFTADSWAPLQTQLLDLGIKSISIDMPGRKGDGIDPKSITIQTAARKVCAAVSSLNEEVILIGHSQGGAVINQAFKFCHRKIIGLFYISAVAPASGTTAFAALNQERDVNFGKCTRPNPRSRLFELVYDGPLAESFFQELLGTEKGAASRSSMVSEPMGIGTTELDYPSDIYEKLLKVYLLSQKDQVVTAKTQEEIIENMPGVEIARIDSGHSPQLTHTKDVSVVLEKFLKRLRSENK